MRSTAQYSAHALDSSADIPPAGYCIWREKSMAITLPADTPHLFMKMSRKCLIVMLILSWARWVQPFEREDILPPAGTYFSMYWTNEETSCSSTSFLFKGYSPEWLLSWFPSWALIARHFVSLKVNLEVQCAVLCGAWKYAFCCLSLIRVRCEANRICAIQYDTYK